MTVANMSGLLQPYIAILKNIVCMREARRRAYLRDCNRDIIDCFSECAKNDNVTQTSIEEASMV